MQSLFDNVPKQEILDRINKLTPEIKGQWGKMDVSQMLAHCNQVMAVAIGDLKLPRPLSGRIIGAFISQFLYNEISFPKNSPTGEGFKITDQRDFDAEKIQLISLVNRFHDLGIEKLPKHKHPYFGRLTNKQWGLASYKHLSYHLNQFGV